MAVDPKVMVDPESLRQLMINAQKRNRPDMVLECQLRLAELAGQKYEDQIEREFWTAVTVAEEFKTIENGRTTRLTRTRQKYERVGAMKCISDWALNEKVTEGFRILVDAGRPDLTGEAIVLRHPDLFNSETVSSAKRKLEFHDVDISKI